MPLRKAAPKGPSRVKQGTDVRQAHGRDAVHAMHRGGHATVIERALEYRGPQPPAKRARAHSPDVSLDDENTPPVEDTPYVAGPEIVMPDMLTLTSGSPLDIIAGNPIVIPASSVTDPSAQGPQTAVSAKEDKKDNKKRKKKKKQSQAAKVSDWEPHESVILDAMFSREYAPGIGKLCECGARPADARCLECGAMKPLCQPCMAKAHTHLHFHWIDVWNGDFFERKDLSALSHIIYLGHNDTACPHIPTGHAPTDTVIVHTNGVHRCSVQYCHCANPRPHFDQLMTSGYWPSSLDSPQTAFTEAVLKDWHLHWDISHKSAQDYFRVKVRLTNNSNPGAVDDRYREFLLASRLWRHYTSVKRAGRRHGIVIPHWDSRCIAVPCLTCPRPGFNLPDDWESLPDHLQYIYGVLYGTDGNHSLYKKTKNDDEDDHSLAEGNSYIIDHTKMLPYLRRKYVKEDTLETCSGFKVARSQRPGKFRFMDVTGIIATTCKHIMFCPESVVDMNGGEALGHADFSLGGAIRSTGPVKRIGESYDVACITIRNILTRFKDNLPDLLPIVKKIEFLLPSMHIHAHKDLCQSVYAFANAFGWGLAHGEGVETPWAEFNLAGLPTREMSAGARHDALISLFNFWNWEKIEKMPQFLSTKLQEAYAGQHRTTKYFAGLTALAGPSAVTDWLSIPFDNKAPTPLTFKEKEAAYAESPFLVNRSKVPSARKAYDDLVEGHQAPGSGTHTRQAVAHLRQGLAEFLMTGLELEKDMLDLREAADIRKAQSRGIVVDDNTLKSTTTWTKWRRRVDLWRVDQVKYMPELGLDVIPNVTPQPTAPRDDDSDDDDDDEDGDKNYHNVDDKPKAQAEGSTPAVEKKDGKAQKVDEILGLPSDFSQEDRKVYQLELLADYEFRLRVGQAFDQLDKVREAVKHLAAYIEEKKENAHSVADNTKSQDVTKFSVSYCQRVARRYNYIYDRLLALRGEALTIDPSDPASRLRRIDLTKDLKIANLKVAREQGDRHRSGSWIWWVFEEAMDPAAADDKMDSTATTSTKPSDTKHCEKTVAKGSKNTKSPERKTKSSTSAEKSHGKTKNGPQISAKEAAKRQLKEATSSSKGKQRAQDGPETDGRAYTTWFDRAQWFRAWQEKLRYDEAVNILCAEFRATIRGSAELARLWQVAAEQTTVSGERAYALQHHAMFTRMSNACQAAYDEARADGVDADTVDQSKSIRSFLKKQVKDMGQWDRVLRKLKA